MKIAISGASGFIGTALTGFLKANNHEVFPVDRTLLRKGIDELAGFLEGKDAVINLAGFPVLRRWNKRNRRRIYDSRIQTTQLLVKAINRSKVRPEVLISASAIGIYQSPGIHSESSRELDEGFLGDVCRDWETEARRALCRKVLIRTGIVLGKGGGALKSMLLPFKLGMGGPIASGKQGFSWIHMDDVLYAILHLLNHSDLSGAYNLTAPHPVSNKGFTAALGKVLHRPAIIPVPAFVLKLIYGKGADTLIKGSFVRPVRLTESGYTFRYAVIDHALKDLLG